MKPYRTMQPQAVVVLNHRGEIIQKLGPYTHSYEIANAKAFLAPLREANGYYITATRWDLAEIGGSANHPPYEGEAPSPCPGNEYGHFYRVHTPGAVWCSRCGERRPDHEPPSTL